ncbi:hypothetical protein O6H91_19G071600 [Diphasiastrum complanatum]|uniref:Uncharacterized protein n=1 Tax=Diphasiastrum complanatum TaxID=34168 RepID=A0ACC2AWJ3_DIPCM|nr:hypothetical protein O6H91_19G071600 [Diphasiastrum complanatum]
MIPARFSSSRAEATRASYRPLIDIPANSDQFTDITLDFHSSRLHQNENKAGAIVYCFVLAIFAVGVAISPWLPGLSLQLLSPILCSCNILLLMTTGVLQDHFHAQAKKERRQGFLNFSEQLEFIAHLPFTIMSYGTAGLLLVVSWEFVIHTARIYPHLILRFVLLLELAWTGSVVGVYMWKVHVHNSSHMQPDAVNLLHSVMRPSTLGDLRYTNGGGLLELQATLLHYQQENLSYLNKEILRLQEILSKYECSQDGSTPQVDVVHLLGAREQELRAVAAERDQLQSEIRLARSLIADRDADVLRARTTNDKHIEESERLRAMLDEWSSRTAKVFSTLHVCY